MSDAALEEETIDHDADGAECHSSGCDGGCDGQAPPCEESRSDRDGDHVVEERPEEVEANRAYRLSRYLGRLDEEREVGLGDDQLRHRSG